MKIHVQLKFELVSSNFKVSDKMKIVFFFIKSHQFYIRKNRKQQPLARDFDIKVQNVLETWFAFSISSYVVISIKKYNAHDF